MPPGSRMPMAGLQVGSPSGPPYGAVSPMRPGVQECHSPLWTPSESACLLRSHSHPWQAKGEEGSPLGIAVGLEADRSVTAAEVMALWQPAFRHTVFTWPLPPFERGRYICRSYSSKHWTAWLPVLNSPLSDQLTVSREGIGIGSKLPWGSTIRTLKPNEDSSSVHNNCFADCFSRNVPFLEDVGRLKRRKMADKVLPQRIRELVPESQAYMDLLAFERKLDQTIARKRMEIQEAIKKPLTQKRKLRIYISNTFTPGKEEGDGSERVASWELRVEGKLLEDPSKQKRKFSSFFKSLVIELDKELYGPDNHLVEPPQYKLDPRLARLLGVHTQTRASIMQALWLYIKHNKLQDSHEKEYINCNRYFRQIFSCIRMRFSEIPMKLAGLLQHPDPIIINHMIRQGRAWPLLSALGLGLTWAGLGFGLLLGFFSSVCSDWMGRIHETIESINQLKTQRDFMLSFSNNPQDFIQEWIKSQRRDLKIITDVIGNPEEERRADFYHQPWAQEAAGRHIFAKAFPASSEPDPALWVSLTAAQGGDKYWSPPLEEGLKGEELWEA
ncbi:SWI/SNF-related matrix-associated actin-dependent regulator of chromatin subfamily D member 2 [Chelonia mydas]|uniref:SWI/SNF-related matrix-associated actin-dependent regulator of chromatin subfamily D member 2 n=1 Tax=Chelonia mydas TaxID=8469 RepID=M7B7N6_CHEMY|nr:SWI/SNF-related matrix-associated actin-dependent regulator of chromatin subfamily D member 2 [Chelonia mydas]